MKWLYRKDSSGFFIAWEEGVIQGFASAHYNWIDLDGKEVVELHEITVRKESQRRGIGKALMMRIFEETAKRGRDSIALWVGEDNINAIKFYEKLGFIAERKLGVWMKMVKRMIMMNEGP